MNADTKFIRINSTNYVNVLVNTTEVLTNIAETNKNIYLKSLKIVNEDAISYGFYATIETDTDSYVFMMDSIGALSTIFWEDPTGMAIPYGGKFKVKVGAIGTVGINVIATYIGGV